MRVPEPAPVPTKAQAELLDWMIGYENGDGMIVRIRSEGRSWRGGDLIDFYRSRALEAAGVDSSYVRYGIAPRGGYADHGWRRAGGTALANLAKRGFVERVGINGGTPLYELTDLGRQAERQYRIVEGEFRWVPGDIRPARQVGPLYEPRPDRFVWVQDAMFEHRMTLWPLGLVRQHAIYRDAESETNT